MQRERGGESSLSLPLRTPHEATSVSTLMEESWNNKVRRQWRALRNPLVSAVSISSPSRSRSSTSQNFFVKWISGLGFFFSFCKRFLCFSFSQMGISRRIVCFRSNLSSSLWSWLFLHFSTTPEMWFLWPKHEQLNGTDFFHVCRHVDKVHCFPACLWKISTSESHDCNL